MAQQSDRPATTSVEEGATTLTVPVPRNLERGKGPGTIEGGLFFNPAMRFSRDLSILVVEQRLEEHVARKGDRTFGVYDGLSATGARALRLAREVRDPSGRLQVMANDRDRHAVELLRGNVETNALQEKVTVVHDDFALGMGTQWFDVVDVDPFGSPAPFLDSAVQHLHRKALLAVTATDTTALCGVYPNVCRRRYDARPWHGTAMHEVALRILAGTLVRLAARHDRALRPVLSHATDHYVRIYFEAEAGARKADEALQHIGMALEAADGTRRLVSRDTPRPVDAVRWAGPLWTGPLQDKDLCVALLERLEAHPRLERPPLERFLQYAAEEADAPPLFYEIGERCERLGISPPRREVLFERLRAAGHTAARTHIEPTAFKTDASGPQLDEILRAAAPEEGTA